MSTAVFTPAGSQGAEPFASAAPLKAPFPAFGGKSKVAAEVWSRFGDVRNYVEPFAFSGAVLLRRPGGAGAVETINDRNAFVANFWRAIAADPDGVARHADHPVNETDLHARHRWLVNSSEANARLDRVREDPFYYDVLIAGWWCWGACCWIGSGWCDETNTGEPWVSRLNLGLDGKGNGVNRAVDHLGGGRGVNAVLPTAQVPHLGEEVAPSRPSPNIQQPHLDAAARGLVGMHGKLPHLDAAARGLVGMHGKLPHLQDDAASLCDERRAWVTAWMRRLADRLRPVRVCCGDWKRVCDSESTMTRLGVTGVFLDPPYRKKLGDGTVNRTAHIYANDRLQDVDALCDDVQLWCLKWGAEKDVRIALCGLEGKYPLIVAAGWDEWAWKSNGGYGNQREGKKNENAARERVWFSPGCLKPGAGKHVQAALFR